MPDISRRTFLGQASALTASALVAPSLARAAMMAGGPAAPGHRTLTDGWEYMRMPLAGPWEAWSDQPIAPWSKVSLPHCFNSYDGCDPDTPAYRGKGWYRRTLEIENPYMGGRTLLHFEGAGQTSAVYLGLQQVGQHIGGYDEFVIDLTAFATGTPKGKKLRLSVLCDNSPDLERMPSDLSDFTLYGGLYRPVHLVYVPVVSVEMVHVRTKVAANQSAQVTVEARLYNPAGRSCDAQVSVLILAPDGSEVHRVSKQKALWKETQELVNFSLTKSALWSPRTPQLYECRVTVVAGDAESVSVERRRLSSAVSYNRCAGLGCRDRHKVLSRLDSSRTRPLQVRAGR